MTTSDSARALILSAMPGIEAKRFHVIPHGRDFPEFFRLRQAPVHGEPIRILVLGNIDASKGRAIIQELADYDKAGCLEFHMVGGVASGSTPGWRPRPNIVEHGAYDRSQFAQKAAAVRPHLGAIFSIWDETYCHTLTELWSVGVPAVVFDYPNVANRVRQSGAGWVLDHHSVRALYEDILRVAFDAEEQVRTDAALSEWQHGYGIANTSRVMAAGYLEVYRDVLRQDGGSQDKSPDVRIAVVCPSASHLRKAYPSTYVRIWERTRNTIDREATYIRMRPETLLANVREKAVDGAIIQRTAIPRTMVEELLRAFSGSGIPYLLDLDDDLTNVPPDKVPEGVYAPYLQQLVDQATVLTVSTQALLEVMLPRNPRTTLLSNRLSDRLWRPEPPARVVDGLVRAVYMGTSTHGVDLEMILPALDAVAAAAPEFRLTLIGVASELDITSTRASWLESISVPYEAQTYDAFVRWLRAQVGRFDFGLAPMEDTSFNMGKSSLKLLDYGALGLPVIASDVGVYRTAAPGVRLVGNSTEQWIQALEEQVALGEENRVLGEELRRWVLQANMLKETLPDFDVMLLNMVKDV